MIYEELTRLHYKICHEFYESCRANHPHDCNFSDEERQMLDDIDTLDRLAKKYFNAEFKYNAYHGID